MQRVHVEQDFNKPVGEIFAHLAEHENLEALFGARVKRLKDGDDGTRNGVGSVRQLKIGPLPAFEETTTEVVPDQLIRYRITKGSPLKGHEGVMRFSSDGDGRSRLDYVITFGSKVPGVDVVVKKMLDRSIRAGLRKLA